MRFLATILLLLPISACAVTLQAAYDLAGPALGYNKYLDLSPLETYTGGVTVMGLVAIRGNGALIDLEHGKIHVGGNAAHLDIDHCVLLNGGNPVYGPGQGAVNFVASSGDVVNCTIYGATVGVRVYQSWAGSVTVKNNILALGSRAGVICEMGSEAVVIYNDGWQNAGYGNYAIDYYCVNGGIQAWTPPGPGNISVDPLWVDPAGLNFLLTAESPCLSASESGGYVGALGTTTTAVPGPPTWGRIKRMF